MKPTLLILAAGMGSRYGGLKQIEPIGPNGETILEYSVYDAIRSGFGKVVFVIRQSFAEEFITRFEPKLKGKIEVQYAFQEIDNLPEGYKLPEGREKPWGTGHAVLCAAKTVNEPFAVINADDFYGYQAFQAMASFLCDDVNRSTYAMVGYLIKNTLSDFGTVSRGICQTDKDGYLTEITERHNIGQREESISYVESGNTVVVKDDTLVSMNFWGFHPDIFNQLDCMFRAFLDKRIGEPKSEFYIPGAVFDLIQSGLVKSKVLSANSTWFGVTYVEDKPIVIEKIKKLVTEVNYPQKLF